MANPKAIAIIVKRLLTMTEEDINRVVIGALSVLLFFILIAVLVVQVLLSPLNVFVNELFPEESNLISQFQQEYSYVLDDLEEYSYAEDHGTESIIFENDEAMEAFIASFDIPAERQTVINTAMPLVSKVEYFWGGKSKAGWNSSWGELRLVTAPGSRTSGTYQPYGLDCSGFVDWVYKTAGYGNVLSGGTVYQWGQSIKIEEEDLIPGDLAFKNVPGKQGINHVGIYLGKNEEGRNLFIHCASGEGVVVNDYPLSYFRRVLINY